MFPNNPREIWKPEPLLELVLPPVLPLAEPLPLADPPPLAVTPAFTPPDILMPPLTPASVIINYNNEKKH